MQVIGFAISIVILLIITPSDTYPSVLSNDVFTCRFGDDFYSEIDCILGDFNETSSRPVRTLNINLPNHRYLTSSSIPRIRAPRFAIHAPYLEYIVVDAFAGFEDTILFLKIVNGSLKEVPEALKRLRRLRTLDLNGNKIRSLSNSLRDMRSVRHLSLSDNLISTIDKAAFHNDLQAVSLTNNSIQFLNGSLTFKKSMNWLFISHNRISLLIGELDGMESLQLLDASWNNIKDIALASLNLPLLEILDLSHNEIFVLECGLKGLPRLRTLDLSNNRLDELDVDNFSSLRNLQVLRLSGNNLRWLDEKVFDCLTKLNILDLSLNQMKEFNALVIPDDSVRNDVLISEIPTNVPGESSNEICDFRLNTPLKTLNITGNAGKCDSIFIQSVLRLRKQGVKLIGNPC